VRRWVQVKLLKERWGRKRAREGRVGRCVWQIRCGRQRRAVSARPRAALWTAANICRPLTTGGRR